MSTASRESGIIMDDDVKEKVIVMNMNRPKPDARDKPRLPSPGEISEDARPFSPGPRPGLAGRSQGVAPAEAARDPLPQPKTGPAGREPDGGPEEFDPDSTDYKAFGWAGNRTLPSLVVILKDGSECGFNYADLASACPDGSMFFPSAPGFKGNVIRLRFAGDDGVFLVVIEGLRLRRVWRLIMAHQTPWIYERPEGMEFVDPDGPVIRSIEFPPAKAARAAARAGG
jgi:hypothetical protein